MTYSKFHAIFNIPLLIILSGLNFLVAPWSRGELLAFFTVLAIVGIFTTPWDNAAAKWGLWGFPRDRVLAWLGYLPVEEYAFFFLQSINVMLLTRWSMLEFGWRMKIESGIGDISPVATVEILVIWAAAWLLVWLRPPRPCYHYAIHLLFWFLPVLCLQWAVAPTVLASHEGLLFLVFLVMGTYYTLADMVAVKAGTWFFDEKQITGHKFGGILPWEEAAFFFLTSLLVAQSYLILLPPEAR